MSSLELAIRRALEKAGPGADATQRARIYQSARNALENGLRQQKISDPNLISEQRRQLDTIINLVERDARLDFMEYEAKERAAREEAEREEERRLAEERAEVERQEAEAAREQAEREAELRRRREIIDRERAAREAEYEAAQRALRERIAAREQAQREAAARERERQEEEARREAQQERAAADQAEREVRLREQAAREEAESERRRQAEIARAEGERRRQEVERSAREEEARQRAARQAERERAERESAEQARQQAEHEAAERQRRTEDEARRLEAELASVELNDARDPADQVRPIEAAPPVAPVDTMREEARFDNAPSVEPDRPQDNREPVFDIMPEVEPRETLRGGRQAPVFDIEAPEPAHTAPKAPAAAERELDTPPERAVKPRKRRRWKAKAFAVVTLVAFAGAGWWWVESTGLMLPASVRNGSVPNPPPTVQDEDFDGAKQLKSLSRQGGYGEEWTKLFDAGQSPKVTAGAQTVAKSGNGGSGPYIDITSSSPGVDGSVAIELPQSIIASLQGKKSSISLTIQGGDKPVQVAVECEFGGLGNCGRHRFLLERNKTDLLFDVTVKADGAADGPGRLLINADAGGEGNSVKLYAIHVLPGG